jgi:hypothetical protein
MKIVLDNPSGFGIVVGVMKNKNYIIDGSHRHRISYVTSNDEIPFVIEREQDEFLGRPTGFSYFVRSTSPKHRSFLAESWGEVIAKLNEILA